MMLQGAPDDASEWPAGSTLEASSGRLCAPGALEVPPSPEGAAPWRSSSHSSSISSAQVNAPPPIADRPAAASISVTSPPGRA